MHPIHIPARLNGYDIVAACPNFTGYAHPSLDDWVIFGVDPSRRTGKYVTAHVMARPDPDGPPTREWFWGHYFDDKVAAHNDFLDRCRLFYATPDAVTS